MKALMKSIKLCYTLHKSLRKLPVQSGLGYGIVHKATKTLKLIRINNADVEWVCWWLHYFPKCVAALIPRSITTGYLFWGFLIENMYKGNPHMLEWFKHNIELCIEMSLQKLFTGLQQTWGKEWIPALLNIVVIFQPLTFNFEKPYHQIYASFPTTLDDHFNTSLASAVLGHESYEKIWFLSVIGMMLLWVVKRDVSSCDLSRHAIWHHVLSSHSVHTWIKQS